MNLAVYVLVCLAFYVAFMQLDLVGRTLRLFTEFRAASQVVADASLNDLEKERRIRQAALSSLGQSVGLVARLTAVLIFAALPIALAMAAAGLELGAFASFSLHPMVLICTVIALAGVERARRALAS